MSARRARCTCSAILFLVLAAPVAGQTPSRPFGRLNIGLGVLRRVGTDTLTALYRSSPLAQLLLETPYHHGSLVAGVQASRYDRRTAQGQSFTGVFPFIGWTGTRPLAGGMELSAGGRLGTMLMYFADGPGTPAANEVELGWAAESRLRRPLGRRWAVDLSVQYRQIATAPITGELVWGLGVTARTGMPGPLRRLLLPRESPGARVTVLDPRASSTRTAADLLRLADGWDRSTVDGVAWTLAPRGLTPLDEPGWRVDLDGAPIELGLLGTRDPSRLLLPLDLLESVQSLERPQFAAGGLVKTGALHLTTRAAPPGFSASFRSDVGNEVGDPGPFRHTAGAAGNVERWGPGAAMNASWRRGPVTLTAALSHQKQSLAGDLLHLRHRPMPADWYPAITRVAPFGSVVLGGARASVRVLAGSSGTDVLFFLPAWGRETFARDALGYQAAIGRARLPGGLEARAAASRSLNRLSADNAVGVTDFDWEIEDRWSYAEIGRAGSAESRVGVSLQRRAARTGFPLADSTDSFHRLYADHWWTLPGSWKWHTGLEALGQQGRWAGSVATGVAVQWPGAGEFSIHLGSSRSLPEERESFWLWAARGYDLIQQAGGALENLTPPVAGRVRSLDGAVRQGRPSTGRIEIEWYVRELRGLALGTARFRWDSVQRLFTGAVQHIPDARGTVAGGRISLRRDVGAAGEIRTGYRYQAPVAGDPEFRRAYRSTPTHAAHVTAGSALAPDLTMWSRLDFRSAREWTNWSAIAPDSLHPWTPAVPARWTLELTARKLLAAGRLESHISLRAPLGGRLQHHPIGIRSRLQLWIAGELRLGTLPAPRARLGTR